ncbi:protein phosphatase 2C family protein [Artemisia annua]|uniref:Protein phosphatase 2C family protein n=1 Tax=Artemisia annua TaxID=35608 RepID=A0A2U1Q246_ARTAN|nr:protein phosphatase 2C family protein [Artemisia annua]
MTHTIMCPPHHLAFFESNNGHLKFDYCAAYHKKVLLLIPSRVTKLVLENLNLQGRFDSLNSLTHLRIFSLKNNHLTGPVSDLSNLTSLKLLFLSNNFISGEFPPSLPSLFGLYCLDLSFNNFSGEIPATESLRTRGLKDDTTCIVVDIIPLDTAMPPPSPSRKKPSKFNLRSLFFKKRSHGSAIKLSKKPSVVGIVEELFEEGSAMLSERLGNEETCGPSTSGLFMCVVCQVDLGASEWISVHAGSIFSTSSKPWEDPFLCADCRNKKDAMEGK